MQYLQKKVVVIKKRILALSMAALLLVGCGKKLTEGEIYGKEFLPEETTITYVPFVYSDGKTSHTTIIPMVFDYPDRWRIDIRSFNVNEEGEYETASYFTSEEVFEACDIGDVFSYEPERDSENEPVRKEKVE